MPRRSAAVHGLKAGLIGATVLAFWFLVIDSLDGRPFHTPAFLSEILLHLEGVDSDTGLIALYTVIHYAAFCVVGLAAAWLMSQLEAAPSLLLGLVLGFVLFDLVFYFGVVFTGVDVVDQLGWPAVLSGNVLAGLGLMGYLGRAMGVRSPAWVEALPQNRILREGVTVGVIGAVTVAVWFFILDMVRGQLLFTPAALGSAIFLGTGGTAGVEFSVLTVGGYTLVHFLAFIAVGLGAAAFAAQAERVNALLLAGILIFAAAEAMFLGLIAVLAEWLLGALGWIGIGVGNLLAAAAMAAYLLRAHPALRAALLRDTLVEEEPPPGGMSVGGSSVGSGP